MSDKDWQTDEEGIEDRFLANQEESKEPVPSAAQDQDADTVPEPSEIRKQFIEESKEWNYLPVSDSIKSIHALQLDQLDKVEQYELKARQKFELLERINQAVSRSNLAQKQIEMRTQTRTLIETQFEELEQVIRDEITSREQVCKAQISALSQMINQLSDTYRHHQALNINLANNMKKVQSVDFEGFRQGIQDFLQLQQSETLDVQELSVNMQKTEERLRQVQQQYCDYYNQRLDLQLSQQEQIRADLQSSHVERLSQVASLQQQQHCLHDQAVQYDDKGVKERLTEVDQLIASTETVLPVEVIVCPPILKKDRKVHQTEAVDFSNAELTWQVKAQEIELQKVRKAYDLAEIKFQRGQREREQVSKMVVTKEFDSWIYVLGAAWLAIVVSLVF